MEIDCSKLCIGEKYSRKELANLWGYDGTKGLEKGIVHPKGSQVIVLFVTKEKDKAVVQYTDVLEDNILIMDGQLKHGADKAVREAKEIYLFYRRSMKCKNQMVPFTYYGKVHLSDVMEETEKPSRFVFQLE